MIKDCLFLLAYRDNNTNRFMITEIMLEKIVDKYVLKQKNQI